MLWNCILLITEPPVDNGVRPVAKTQAEIITDEQTAKQAFNRLVNESWYSRQTTDEVIRLADFGIKLPTYTPTEYTDPNDKSRIYRLTDEEQDRYKEIRNGIYDALVQFFMSAPEYSRMNDTQRANVMSAVGRATTDLAKQKFLIWIASTRPSEPKKTWETEEEDRVMDQYDEYVAAYLAQLGIQY